MPKFNGYAEGFYGKLLGWSSRFRLLTLLKSCGFNSYLYAPKEDLFHRRDWRMAYSNDWCRKFTEFTKAANNCGVSVFAGIAPGLDFDFSSLDKSYELSGDLSVLVEKAKVLRSCGAAKIVILMDDIDSDFDTRRGQFSSEGKAHAKLVNLVGEAINEPIIIVPRIYSDSLIHVDDEQSQFYLRDLMTDLNEQHFVVYCGDDIVAKRCGVDSKGYIPERRAIVWDNFYANDYSPRRLYLGPWRKRGNVDSRLLNITGMIETDSLLLKLVSESLDYSNDEEALTIWRRVMVDHELPVEFFDIAFYLDAPFGFKSQLKSCSQTDVLKAIEFLLWNWKSPIQLEWYSVLMGLKQDLLIDSGQMSKERIMKTQSFPLGQTIGKFSDKN